ncbi:hypothetical protein FHW58_000487 [Duganella sp. 1224]|uniref:hypothetical protein n=1 Tax=Duganella sp. 1224 TaxID=2587052 RepID=UPI0015CC5C48|nr:hypothetical protein [Duganella sp. 1224]NYE59335.1 hypothetical protein [Duganella sp. 1224]
MSKQIFKSIKILLCVLSWGWAITAAQAQESLFIATVQRVTLEPRGGQFCPDLCEGKERINSDGRNQVCVSNDGGCDHTEYVVNKVLLGEIPLGAHKFDTRIGEWGGTHFPVSNQPILVHMKPGSIEWVPIVLKDGRKRAKVKAFRYGILEDGTNLRALAYDDEDGVALDTLVERLSEKNDNHLLRSQSASCRRS